MALDQQYDVPPGPGRVDGGRWIEPDGTDGSGPVEGCRRMVIRRLNPWSTVRLAALWSASLAAVALVAVVVLWLMAAVLGLQHRLETFMRSIGFDQFHLHFGPVFRFTLGLAIVLTFAGTVLAALSVALFNAISRLVGGITVEIGDAPVPRRSELAADASPPAPDAAFRQGVSRDGRVSSARSGL